jgi:soluble P-type ATPase
MIELNIPGCRQFKLSHLVLDFNGTLAQDGRLDVGVRRQLLELAEQITIHVVTGNTFGRRRTASNEL